MGLEWGAVLISVVIVAVVVVVGALTGLHLRRRDPGISLDDALRRNPRLYVIGGVMVAPGVIGLGSYLAPRWTWSLPLLLEASFDILMVRSIVSVLAFGLALTTTIAFAAGDRRRWGLLIASPSAKWPGESGRRASEQLQRNCWSARHGQAHSSADPPREMRLAGSKRPGALPVVSATLVLSCLGLFARRVQRKGRHRRQRRKRYGCRHDHHDLLLHDQHHQQR